MKRASFINLNGIPCGLFALKATDSCIFIAHFLQMDSGQAKQVHHTFYLQQTHKGTNINQQKTSNDAYSFPDATENYFDMNSM